MSKEPAANNFDDRKPELSPQAALVLKRLRAAAREQRLENEARAKAHAAPETEAGGAPHTAPARDADIPDMEGVFFPPEPPSRKKRSYALLIMVFVLSAAVTGALGGLLLAKYGAPSGKTVTAKVRGTTIVRRQSGMGGMTGDVKASPAAKAKETTIARQPATTPPAPALTAPPVAAPAPAAPATRDGMSGKAATPAKAKKPAETILAKTPANDATAAPAKAKATQPKAQVTAAGARPPAPAANAASIPLPPAAPAPDSIKALTDNVVNALKGLSGQREPDMAGTGDLRQALQNLVTRALSKGHDTSEIAGLLDTAIKEAGAENLPGALRDAQGRIDTRQLIASVIPADKTARSAGDASRSFMAEIVKEAHETSMKPLDDGSADQTSRFIIENGQRYTIIRPGDTLSGIAFAAYNDVLAYPLILRANAGRISVRNLKPGTRIVIPEKGAPRQLVPIGKATARRKAAPAKRKAVRNRGRKRPLPAGRKSGQRKITDRLLGAITSSPAASASPAQARPAPVTNFKRVTTPGQ